ncbi:non-ribosomal peptide synthetase, partial [Pseudoalteromonas luteoviolacea]|uniref:non-ribosomal peptide synthetase n=1 Tax=Pseudoalteromonas luteoviolacea TaxID=43657 RepID=UPI000B0D254A
NLLTNLCEQTSDLNMPLQQLSMLSADETEALLIAPNQSAQAYPSEACLHELISQQVKRNPTAKAVCFGEEYLTYEALEQRANVLAYHLITEHQVQANQLIGLCVERSLDMIVSVLGILKAGGAYYPLDLEHGVDINIARLGAQDVSVLVVSAQTAAIFSECQVAQVQVGALSDTNLDLACVEQASRAHSSSQLAYVLSSSGTTGKPKSIGLCHKALHNLIVGMGEADGELKRAHRVLQFASIGFDMSYTDTALALLQGGSVHLIEQETRYDVGHLIEVIQTQQLSVLNLPYAMLSLLAEVCVEKEIQLKSVEVIISTAEKLVITPTIKAFFAAHSTAKLINHFGPTETHVCTIHSFTDSPESWQVEPAIGTPIANSQAYVLAPDGSPTPFGSEGELYIAGDCLAHGYIGDNARTAEKFIALTLAGVETRRAYRTGDIVKWVDGALHYAGRTDDQIKRNGFRLELKAIEQEMQAIAGVEKAKVIYNAKSGHGQLIGYFVSNEIGDEQRVRDALLEALPEYMRPDHVVQLAQFELTVNGKINTAALPDITELSAQSYVALETDTERHVAEIFSELLGVDVAKIGRNANFFSLGGHSLLA